MVLETLVAATFLQDVDNLGIRFVFDSIQPASQTEFSGNGRSGAYFEAQAGQIEVGDVPLPVQLASFQASVSEQGTELNWRTLSELNNAGFHV